MAMGTLSVLDTVLASAHATIVYGGFLLSVPLLQSPLQGCEPLCHLVVSDRHADRAPAARQHAQFSCARNGCVQQVALQHRVMLGDDRHDHNGKF